MKKCRSCQKEIDNKAKKCPYCQEKQGNWAQRHPILTGILGIILLFIVIGASSGGSDTPTSQSNTISPNTEVIEESDTTKSEDSNASETVSQKNAVRKAKSYLSISGYSRSGLIKQLEFEKFSTEDATYAVDAVGADWNEQASKKAKSYLDISGYSRESLINQLEFEGFTTEQASYGADAVGL
ncbi:MAG: hypothetical protein AUK08_03580 [Candidatus Pacebacteria bacterium CG2_30_36_39]|nr:MAG: hypothetical protein AUK08_03580 [Candidatus Pacebacteria bacterium CG2_30_36_39]